MTYDQWLKYREAVLRAHPPTLDHLRLDIELAHPRKWLEDVPVDFNPHRHGGGYHARYLFYECDDWSVRSEAVLIDESPHGTPTWRMLVESGHQARPSDKLTLYSTSCSIVHESWAAQKNWNDFAYCLGMYWRVTWNEYFGEWPGGRVWGLPFQDRRHYDDSKRLPFALWPNKLKTALRLQGAEE